MLVAVGGICVALWLALVRLLRYRRVAATSSLRLLEPGNAALVQSTLCQYEMPFLIEAAVNLGFFYTFAVPSISKLLVATQQFEKHGQKRYDDTEILLSELLEARWAGEHARADAALARMNSIHAGYPHIRQADYAFTACLFVVPPVRWCDQYGWRACTLTERDAIAASWGEIGSQMGIRDMPVSYAGFEALFDRLCAELVAYAPTNTRVADATIDVFLARVPAWLLGVRWLARCLIVAAMPPELARALGYRPAGGVFRALVSCILHAHGLACRFVLPPRPAWLPQRTTTPQLLPSGLCPATRKGHVTYPGPYAIDELGPAKFARDCVPPVHDPAIVQAWRERWRRYAA